MVTTLPPPPRKLPVFAHPIEEAFARVLDFYGIEWEYEPHTFPLEWDERNHVSLAFTPDFYLTQQDLFVELTTLRPRLATFKNRKIRLMHTLYPEVNIKLFKRRELHKLMVKFGFEEHAQHIVGTEAQEIG